MLRMRYQALHDYYGRDAIHIQICDGGNTGLGAPSYSRVTINVTVEAVNDPPLVRGY